MAKMNSSKIFMLAMFLLMTFAFRSISSTCCGRGKHGYCKDCSEVGILKRRKCCGKTRCNIFCCGCNACLNGKALITYAAATKERTCKNRLWGWGDVDEAKNANQFQNTRQAFDHIDQDQDNVISPDEFLDAMMERLTDHEEAHVLSSDLLQRRDEEEVVAFLDEANGEGVDDESIAKLMVKEFSKMDENNDGLIQSSEFDGDLE